MTTTDHATTPEPCRACADATAQSLSGSCRSGCIDCHARMLARSPQFHQAMTAGTFVPAYDAALRAVFGDEADSRDAGHRRVKAWAKTLGIL